MKKLALICVVIGATMALTSPAIAQGPGPGGPGPGGPGRGRMDMAARMAQMEKLRESVYAKLGLTPKQKRALAKLDKHVLDEQKAMFAKFAQGARGPGGPGGPGGSGGPGGRGPGGPGGPGGRGPGGRGPGGPFGAIRKEREDGMKKILSKAQYDKYQAEWAKVAPRRGGGMRGPGGPGGRPRGR